MKTKAVFTEGPIGAIMLKAASAMLVGTVAMSLYNIVDTYFVGQLGTIPLAAMGFTLPAVMLVGCIFRGIFSGIVALTAQNLGAADHPAARRTVTAGLYLTILLSLLLAITGKAASYEVFRSLGAQDRTLELTQGYMDIWFLGGVTGMVGLLGSDLLIAVGNTSKASLFMLLATSLNALLDYLLIFGKLGLPAMGIEGAALATIISQALGAIGPWYLICKKYGLFSNEGLGNFQFLPVWKKQLLFGIPIMLGNIILPVGQTVVTRVAASFGDVAVAAMGAVSRLEVLAFMVPMSVGFSLTPFVAQNFGASLYKRLRSCYKIANTFAFSYLLLLAAAVFFLSGPLVRQFSDDPAVQDLMAQGLKIIVWGFGLLEIFRYSTFFMIGCGHPSMAALLNVLRMGVLTIPLSLLAIPLDNVAWLFWSRLISDVVPGLAGLVLSGLLVWRLGQGACQKTLQEKS